MGVTRLVSYKNEHGRVWIRIFVPRYMDETHIKLK